MATTDPTKGMKSLHDALRPHRPSIAEYELLASSDDFYEVALAELWRGHFEVSSNTAAVLNRPKANAILARLYGVEAPT